jgi:hypothetical protein
MEPVDYELVEPFDIDNGELDGLTPPNVFCLGVEWAMVSDQLKLADSFTRPIHVANASRIKRMCIRRGRRCRIDPADAEWMMLVVADAGGVFQ